jgi:hypothetical protein
VVAVGNEKHLFGPSLGESCHITAAVFQGGDHIGIGINRIEDKKPAYNGLNIPPAFYASGKFKRRGARKGNKMKSISQAELFPEEGAGQVVRYFIV